PAQKPAAAAKAAAPAPVEQTAEPVKPAAASTATPVAQRVASEKGVDLAQVEPSKPGARVTKSDVERFAETKQAPAASPEPALAPASKAPLEVKPPISVASQDGRGEERIKLSRRRRTIAQRLVEAQHNAAMLTTFNEIDMTAVMELRERRKE